MVRIEPYFHDSLELLFFLEFQKNKFTITYFWNLYLGSY
jgi:hypothetical protein